MPVKTWGAKADFDGAYRIRIGRDTGGPVTVANYERAALFQPGTINDYVTPEWSRIVAHFGWPLTTSILIVGCGFGWSIEYLDSQGFTTVWGNDPSVYIQLAKGDINTRDDLQNSLVGTRILANDLSGRAGRRQCLRDSIGQRNRFDVIVTERVLTSLSDAEAQALSADLRADMLAAGGDLVHIESPTNEDPATQDAAMNWKTLADWKTLLPADAIVGSGGRPILV